MNLLKWSLEIEFLVFMQNSAADWRLKPGCRAAYRRLKGGWKIISAVAGGWEKVKKKVKTQPSSRLHPSSAVFNRLQPCVQPCFLRDGWRLSNGWKTCRFFSVVFSAVFLLRGGWDGWRLSNGWRIFFRRLITAAEQRLSGWCRAKSPSDQPLVFMVNFLFNQTLTLEPFKLFTNPSNSNSSTNYCDLQIEFQLAEALFKGK
jgi:hypothetical protein